MVNGNYVLYGDRPSSESEIVDDHIQTRTAERKNRRKANRTANELQRTLNMAQLDNETDSVKYEKKIKEPRLLRYVSTSDVEENFVNEKFETYDLNPTEEKPRRYTFQKKPKNPADGSVNYAYSRSSSSCSSPNGNLPTISEHGEQYGTYRVRSVPSPTVGDIINGYETKMEKYFTKPKEGKGFSGKVNYKGSHPDSLYRVPATTGIGGDRVARVLRVLRWPVALVAVCVALAIFVYFLMPDNTEQDLIGANGTYWEAVAASASHGQGQRQNTKKPDTPQSHETKIPEIDFYDADNDNLQFTSIVDTNTETNSQRILPIQPVFPTQVVPEVQYGNEKADSDNLRTAKALEEASIQSQDSTLKPHITQKPEKPLAVYFKEGNAETTTTTDSINRAETTNEFTNYGDKPTTKKNEDIPPNTYGSYKEPSNKVRPLNVKHYLVTEPEIPPEVQEFYNREPVKVDVNFTSGHSNAFGISIEDAEKMKSTTQNSIYNTRVSPTLPTWRDRDATTIKYPTYANYEVPQCRSTSQTVCRGVLPYDLAGSPATIAGVEVTSLLPQIEYLVATNCSARVKQFACALMEPECSPPPYQPKRPCYNLCKAIVDYCDGLIPRELTPAFNCKQYSRTNCVAARAPCYPREFTCRDHTCVPRDWICDGTQDCPNGEDEAACALCEKNEFRCNSGTCILKRWLCDGYADCPGGEDEVEGCDRHVPGEPGEESAGSAPAPAVRRPNRLPTVSARRSGDSHRTAEIDSSKELLITSDSSNSFKRNFTRRPSPSRLSPYTRSTTLKPAPIVEVKKIESQNPPTLTEVRKFESRLKSIPKEIKYESQEDDINIGDLGFLEDIKKTSKEMPQESEKAQPQMRSEQRAPPPNVEAAATKLDKSINKLEKVINGAALMKKAADEESESLETNSTTIEPEDLPLPEPISRAGSKSAHASPCPSGELRCVDGRCITLAQLCDGTIDCTDHADEDNCYT